MYKRPHHHIFCGIKLIPNRLLTILAFVQVCADFVFSDNVCIGNLKRYIHINIDVFYHQKS